MTETSTSNTIPSGPSGRAPQNHGVAPGLFWTVTAVMALAIGGVYFLVNKNVDDSRAAVNDQFVLRVKGSD